MQIQIVTVNKVRERYLLEGEQEYLRRFPNSIKITCSDLGGERYRELPVEKQQEKHTELLTAARRNTEFLFLLDESGQQFSSVELSTELERRMTSGTSQFCFAIGGAYGWNDEAKKSASLVLSLSKLTFPNQLCRLICLEQIYRAVSILQKTPYHK